MATEAPGKPLCRPLPPAWVPRAQEAQETQQGGRIRGGRRGNTVPLAGMTSCHRPGCTVSGDSTRAHTPPFVLFPVPGGEGFTQRSSPEPQAPLFRNHHVPGGSIDLSRASLSLKWSDPPTGPGRPLLDGSKCPCTTPPAPLHMGKMPPAFGWVHCKQRTSWGHPFPIRHPQKCEKTQSMEGLPER